MSCQIQRQAQESIVQEAMCSRLWLKKNVKVAYCTSTPSHYSKNISERPQLEYETSTKVSCVMPEEHIYAKASNVLLKWGPASRRLTGLTLLIGSRVRCLIRHHYCCTTLGRLLREKAM